MRVRRENVRVAVTKKARERSNKCSEKSVGEGDKKRIQREGER